MNINPFEVLNVSQSATIDEITQARRRLARVYHPDVSGSTEIMQNINVAFEILTDPSRRRQFVETNDNNQEFQHYNEDIFLSFGNLS